MREQVQVRVREQARSRADVVLVGSPPVAGASALSRCQGDGVVADQPVEPVLDAVLDPGPLGAVVGLGPQVRLGTGSIAELQGDEVVLLVVTLCGVTVVRVPGGAGPP